MNPARRHLSAMFAIALVVAACAQAQVVAPARRTAALEAAQQLLAARESTLPTKLTDPFHPENFGASTDTGPVPGTPGDTVVETPIRTGPRTDRDLVAAIAGAIKPSGYFIIGGEPTLVFGQKRVKAGDPLTINFEGADYTLTITAIDRTSFTLRLNREEYTRPIK